MKTGLNSTINVASRENDCIYTGQIGLNETRLQFPNRYLFSLKKQKKRKRTPRHGMLPLLHGMALRCWCLLKADQDPWALEGHGCAEEYSFDELVIEAIIVYTRSQEHVPLPGMLDTFEGQRGFSAQTC